jgi:non-heme chloroperoxidase
MEQYATDLAALTAHLDLKNAVRIGHSTGGGEVVLTLTKFDVLLRESRGGHTKMSATGGLFIVADAGPDFS